MNNRRLLIAAVFHFVHPVEKDIKKHHKLTQNSVSFSCQSKLTCQILANQSIKIGRRAWPTRDHGKKRSSPPVFLNNWLNFRVRGKFEVKILIVLGHSDINMTYFIYIFKTQTWACGHLKSSNLSADNFKKILDLDGSTPEPAIPSGDTGQRIPCFDSCQLITALMCNQFSPGLRN